MAFRSATAILVFAAILIQSSLCTPPKEEKVGVEHPSLRARAPSPFVVNEPGDREPGGSPGTCYWYRGKQGILGKTREVEIVEMIAFNLILPSSAWTKDCGNVPGLIQSACQPDGFKIFPGIGKTVEGTCFAQFFVRKVSEGLGHWNTACINEVLSCPENENYNLICTERDWNDFELLG